MHTGIKFYNLKSIITTEQYISNLYIWCAGRGSRTLTRLPSLVFETSLSAISAPRQFHPILQSSVCMSAPPSGTNSPYFLVCHYTTYQLPPPPPPPPPPENPPLNPEECPVVERVGVAAEAKLPTDLWSEFAKYAALKAELSYPEYHSGL